MKENKKCQLESRYPDIITIVEGIDDNRGIITTTSDYIRVIEDTTINGKMQSIKAIDFEGGPMVSIGDSLKEIGIPKKIKSIRTAWLIEFEE